MDVPDGRQRPRRRAVGGAADGVGYGAHCVDFFVRTPLYELPPWAVITFNFGLHDGGDTNASYVSNLTTIADRLAEVAKAANPSNPSKLIFFLTTIPGGANSVPGEPVSPDDKRVQELNLLARHIMAARDIPVVDLYAAMTACGKACAGCRPHCPAAGYEYLVEHAIIPAIRRALPGGATCRDRWREPFSSDSIWNTAVGSGARFEPAGIFAPEDPRGDPDNFHNDQDFLVRVTSDDPLTEWINQGDWGSDEHCTVQQHSGSGHHCGPESKQVDGCHTQIRFPANWTSASDCDEDGANCRSAPGQSNNNAMAMLLPDNETIVQMQPVYRCGPHPKPLLARWGNSTDGGPQQFPNLTSILADGTLGAHGGSGLSSIGGSIRLGELLPGAPPIGHALKLELGNWWYWGSSELNPPTPYNGGNTQYVWPATGSNAKFNRTTKSSDAGYTGTNRHLAPGALLAVPASNAKSVNATTVVGRRILQALVDYGGYVVDGSGRGSAPHPHHNLAALCMDAQVNAEMRRAYGFNMAYPAGVRNPAVPGPAPQPAAAALYADLLAIFRALHVVTNNSPSSIGGGGVPRRSRKPPLCK